MQGDSMLSIGTFGPIAFQIEEGNRMNGNPRITALKSVLAGLFVVAFGLPLAAQTKYDHVEYLKSVQQKEKKKGEAVPGAICFDGTARAIQFVNKDGGTEFNIPNAAIKGLHYERTSRPRYAEALIIAWPLIFTKSKKHYLTIQYTDPGGEGHFAILHMDKNNYQQILAAAEAQTGVKVDREEEK
jgi:hypothetical protein